MSCVDKEESKITKTTKVQTVDLWVAIDALDELPETHAIEKKTQKAQCAMRIVEPK